MRIFNPKQNFYSEIVDRKHYAPLGLFFKEYMGSKSYISNLEHIGPIMVSIKMEKGLAYALVRSYAGFVEYKFSSDNLIDVKYGPLALSIFNYLVDFFPGYRSRPENSSLFSTFASLFKSSSKKAIIAEIKPKKENMDSLEYLMYKVVADYDRFYIHKMVGSFTDVHFFHAEKMEELLLKKVYFVKIYKKDLNYLKNFFESLDFNNFLFFANNKNEDKANIDISFDQITVSDLEMKNYIIDESETHKPIIKCIEELLHNELLLFENVRKFCVFDPEKLSLDKFPSLSKEIGLFSELFDVNNSLMRLLYLYFENFPIFMSNTRNYQLERETYSFLQNNIFVKIKINEIKDEEDDGVLIKRLLNILEISSKDLIHFEKVFLNCEDFVSSFSKLNCKDISIRFDGQELMGVIHNIVQRLTKHPLIIKNILENIKETGNCFFNLKRYYIKFKKYITHLDEKKDGKLKVETGNKILRFFNIKENIGDFVKDIDCVNHSGVDVCLFLFEKYLVYCEGKKDGKQDSKFNNTYKIKIFIDVRKIEIVRKTPREAYIFLTQDTNLNFLYKEVYKNEFVGVIRLSNFNSMYLKEFIEEFNRIGTSMKYKDVYFSLSNGDIDLCVDHMKRNGDDEYKLECLLKERTISFSDPEIEECEVDKDFDKVLKNVINRELFYIPYKKLQNKNKKSSALLEKRPFLTQESNNTHINYKGMLSWRFIKRTRMYENYLYMKYKFYLSELVNHNGYKKLINISENYEIMEIFGDELTELINLVKKVIFDEDDVKETYDKVFDGNFKNIHQNILNFISENAVSYFCLNDLDDLTFLYSDENSKIELSNSRPFVVLLYVYVKKIKGLVPHSAFLNVYKRIVEKINVKQDES